MKPKAVPKRKYQHTHAQTQVREADSNVKTSRNKRAKLDQDAPKNTPQDPQTRQTFSTQFSCEEGGASNVCTEQKLRLNDGNRDISLYFSKSMNREKLASKQEGRFSEDQQLVSGVKGATGHKNIGKERSSGGENAIKIQGLDTQEDINTRRENQKPLDVNELTDSVTPCSSQSEVKVPEEDPGRT